LLPLSPLSELELGLVKKLCSVSLPPGSACKRLVNELRSGRIRQMSDRGRSFLAQAVFRFRIQYQLDSAEEAWISEHLEYWESVRLDK
jgi:hypothetical protein